MSALEGSGAPTMKLFTDEAEQQKVWDVREAGLGATAFVPGEPLTWEGWEDSAVAPEKVGGYLRDLCKLYEKYDYRSALYGHFGQGCIHCRLNFDLMSEPGIRKWRSFMEEATDLVTSYGGSISGEHGDGQSKAEFLYKMFGTRVDRSIPGIQIDLGPRLEDESRERSSIRIASMRICDLEPIIIPGIRQLISSFPTIMAASRTRHCVA